MTRVVSTRVSLAKDSCLATPDFKGAEGPHSVSLLEGQREELCVSVCPSVKAGGRTGGHQTARGNTRSCLLCNGSRITHVHLQGVGGEVGVAGAQN